MRRPLEISYTIEDLDLIEHQQRLQASQQQLLRQHQMLSQQQPAAAAAQPSQRPDMRRYRSFLSPDDALRDLRKHASQGAEIRWELHTSRTDVDLASRARCGCHGPSQRRPSDERRMPERGDLRKHHSAEIDKWSLRPDGEHELRKHLSDDSRMDRERKWTLQVPEVHANPKQRCTCPKTPRAVSPSPSASDESSRSRTRSPRVSDDEQPARSSRSLSPQEPPAQPQKQPLQTTIQVQQPQQQQQADRRAQAPAESRRMLRSRWAGKPHRSLPAEKKESKWLKSFEEGKSKSLKERPKYSVRRSMSPDPDPRQVLRLDNRLVRKLISPEISLKDAKWAPYEGYSPLPNVGMRKRDVKKIKDIKWQPYDEPSPARPETGASLATEESTGPPEEPPPGDWSPFHNITPTHLPPPAATPAHDEDEKYRWRFLNQVSAFPIYQGAWREETPPPTPPGLELGTPVWSPQDMTACLPPSQISRPSPSPPQPKRSTFKIRSGRKKASRAKSQESTRADARLSVHQQQLQQQQQQQQLLQQQQHHQLQQQHSQETRRRRPQLLRSMALLEVPRGQPTKRSLSEEVRSYRSESTRRNFIFRAKSEDAARYAEPWCPDDQQELREYVTTV